MGIVNANLPIPIKEIRKIVPISYDAGRTRGRENCKALWSHLMARASKLAAHEAQAHRTLCQKIKQGARRYAARPKSLDNIQTGLSRCAPRAMIANLINLSAAECLCPGRRWIGFGGQVPLINLRSAMIYARLMRRRDRRYLSIPGGTS
jgi:hypothetical protein